MTDDKSTSEAAEESEAPRERRSGRQIGEKRELEQAPLMLRKAAKILLIGAIFPFFSAIKYATSGDVVSGDSFPWGVVLGAKAVALAGCWLFHQGYMATHGGKAQNDAIDKMAKSHHMVMPILAVVFWVASLAILFSASGAVVDVLKFGAIGEVLTVILAGATISHIFGYEHGGKFNPIFPLMFAGMAFAGITSAIAGFGAEGTAKLAMIVGGAVVGLGGGLAAFTIVEAMMQAKKEGDIKKQAQIEERRKARAERKK